MMRCDLYELSGQSVCEMGRRHDLVIVLPENAPRAARVPFSDRNADIIQQPGHVPGSGDVHAGLITKPANAADCAAGAGSVAEPGRRIQLRIEPVHFLSQFGDLPEKMQTRAIVENVKGSAEDATVAAGVGITDAGFETDVHFCMPPDRQPFRRNKQKNQMGRRLRLQIRRQLSLLKSQRKTYLPSWSSGIRDICTNAADQLRIRKHCVRRPEKTA